MEEEDLHLLIAEMRDENSRSRLREALWISIIFHMVVLFTIRQAQFLFPHHSVTLQTPEQMMKQRDLTFLELPPDAQKLLKRPDTNKISDRDRIASSPNPQVDKRALDQLVNNRRTGAPGTNPTQPPAPQQMASNQPPQPQQGSPAEQQQNENQRNDNSKIQSPASQQSIFKASPSVSAGSAIEEAARESARVRGGGVGGENGGGPGFVHNNNKSDLSVLSDTMGVDFNPYLQRVLQVVRINWYAVIPEVAMPPLLKQGQVSIEFVITKNGGVKGMTLVGASGDVSLDRAAWGGISASNPFPPLPSEFKGEYLALRFRFLYNPDRGTFSAR